MQKKMRLFTFYFTVIAGWNYLFIGRGELWSALFVGFFSSLLVAFVFIPLVERPMLNFIKKIVTKPKKGAHLDG